MATLTEFKTRQDLIDPTQPKSSPYPRRGRLAHAIRRHVRNNPAHWALDRDNPGNLRHLTSPAQVEDFWQTFRRQKPGMRCEGMGSWELPEGSVGSLISP